METLKYNDVPIINHTEANWCDGLFLLWADAYGSTRAFVWANSFEDAFEEFVEYLDEAAPGCLCEPEYDEAAKELEAPADWREDEEWSSKVSEHAEMDLTVVEHTTLKNGSAIASWEWGGDDVSDDAVYEAVKTMSLEACAD